MVMQMTETDLPCGGYSDPYWECDLDDAEEDVCPHGKGFCSHTSDWWKQHVPCVNCGTAYTDEEADHIADNPENRHFTPEQQTIVDSIYWNHHMEE